MSSDNTQQITEQVEQALQQKQALCICGSGSHDFMLPDYATEQTIDMTQHHGIIDYQPTELTLRARAGTRLTVIQSTLAEQQQRLPTDFQLFSSQSTLGGALSIGHTGSGRPFLGAIRDHVLGARLINGQAQTLTCGGQVMKNVAGYDVSRLLAGTRGTLGPILDITLKVLPTPPVQKSLRFEMDENQAIESMNKIAGLSAPVTASVYFDGQLIVRLEGNQSGIEQARQNLGGEELPDSQSFWQSIQQQSHAFFQDAIPLWRVIVPASTAKLELERSHKTLIDWCGGLRWVHTEEITQSDFIHVRNMGGYIESFRGGKLNQPADLMTSLQKQMHVKIKKAFDMENIFNPALSKFE